ncbi:PDZ domain-containing protein [bacterium]|nr:PDZ domain-containing protein [bacterium]
MKFRLLLILIFVITCQNALAERFIPESDILKRVLAIVNQLYVDANRIVPPKMLEGALDYLSTSIAPVMTTYREDGSSIEVKISVDQFTHTFRYQKPHDINELNEILQQLIRFVKQHLDENEKPENVDYAVINGFLRQLDPHSSFLIPEIYSDFSASTAGNFGGVGMMIGLRDGTLTIIAPIDDTPASRTGLKAKDQIVQINEESTINMSLTDAVKKLRGEKGTKVDIFIMRKGFTSPKKFTIIRDIIKITSVESYSFKENNHRIGYLKINTFQQNTMDEIDSHLDDLDYDLNDFYGLILDLRNNPGGLLDQAIKVSDRFLNDGVIVSTAGLTPGSIKSYKAHWFRSIVDMPIIVIVNNGSASASEIVAAALKKNNRAVVTGIQTFGKGSVQQVIPFKEGSALRLTTSKYLTPGNISIQSVGVTPHIAVTPYYISTEFLHVTSPKLDQGENSLDQNFAEWGDKADPPKKTVFYLYEDKDENKSEEDSDLKAEKFQRLKDDFLVQTAIKILDENNKKNFDHLLASALAFMTKEQQIQEQKLIEKFAAFSISIDWKSYDVPGQGTIASKVWLESKVNSKTEEVWRKHEGSIPANSDIRLYLTAENTGSIPVAKLMAITESQNEVFNDRQFAFGRLNPGESKKWFIPIKIAESSISRNNLISLEFTDQQKRKIHQDAIDLVIQEKDRPLFQYSVTPYEDGRFQSTGNGNHILENGETIVVKIDVTNRGKGESGPLTILLRNGEGKNIFLKKGLQNIDSLKPEKTQTADFQFDLKGIPQDMDLDFSLDILDGTFPMTSVNQKIKLPLGRIVGTTSNTPPAIQLESETLLSTNSKFDLTGRIHDPEGVKDMYVFLNRKKIYYKNFIKQENRKTVDFTLKLDLEDNNNDIDIVSRDDDDVTARKKLYLRYTTSK